jgi:hypothetical protein
MQEIHARYAQAIEAEAERRTEAVRLKKDQDEKNALRIIGGVYTPKEEAEARQACARIALKHPKVLSIEKNQYRLMKEIEDRKEFFTDDTLEAAYKFLDSEGAFEKSPEPPVQSADEYRRTHPELWDTRTPQLAHESVLRGLDAFRGSRPDYAATAKNATLMLGWLSESGLPPVAANFDLAFNALKSQGLLELNGAVAEHNGTRVVTYPPQQRTPVQPSKYSLRAKVDSMTAEEIRERILADKSFESALDNLK